MGDGKNKTLEATALQSPVDCDAQYPSVYVGSDGVARCRCLVCARCGHHTGNSHQGHYWSFCKVTGAVREFHFCCPGDCELEETKPQTTATQSSPGSSGLGSPADTGEGEA